VNELGLDGAPAVRFVFPNAPMRAVTINNGYVMRAWYDVSFGDLEGKGRRADEAGVRESQAQIGALVEREAGRGIAHKNILLAGFSQGGAVALHTGLRYPRSLGGVMALSTYLPLADSFPQEATAENKATPVFMAHGVFDPVVPLVMGAGSMTFLTGLGYAIDWRQYPMQHSVCAQEVQDIGAWLRKILKA
jgi:phospholipase/carboxylesterase